MSFNAENQRRPKLFTISRWGCRRWRDKTVQLYPQSTLANSNWTWQAVMGWPRLLLHFLAQLFRDKNNKISLCWIAISFSKPLFLLWNWLQVLFPLNQRSRYPWIKSQSRQHKKCKHILAKVHIRNNLLPMAAQTHAKDIKGMQKLDGVHTGYKKIKLQT